jgi:hypothetical protein
MTRVPTILVLALALPGAPALAAEPAPLTSASAVWAGDGHVELTVSWSGGACEEPGEPTVEATEADETTDAVLIPTIATADVCTLQLVQVEFSGLVPVEPLTETLAVTVLAPDGQPTASGSVAIEKAAD